MTNDTFDDLSRNTSRVIALATGFVGTTSETRAYDAINQLTAISDGTNTLASFGRIGGCTVLSVSSSPSPGRASSC